VDEAEAGSGIAGGMGSVVKLRDMDFDGEFAYCALVGAFTEVLANDKISSLSPVGNAIWDAKLATKSR